MQAKQEKIPEWNKSLGLRWKNLDELRDSLVRFILTLKSLTLGAEQLMAASIFSTLWSYPWALEKECLSGANLPANAKY